MLCRNREDGHDEDLRHQLDWISEFSGSAKHTIENNRAPFGVSVMLHRGVSVGLEKPTVFSSSCCHPSHR